MSDNIQSGDRPNSQSNTTCIRSRLEQRKNAFEDTYDTTARNDSAQQDPLAIGALAPSTTFTTTSIADQCTSQCDQLRKHITQEIEALLQSSKESSLHNQKSSQSSENSARSSEVSSKLIDLRNKVLKQQQELARIALSLPLFTRRQANDTLNGLLASIDRARTKLVGSGRFRFVRRPTPVSATQNMSSESELRESEGKSRPESSNSLSSSKDVGPIGQPTIANVNDKIVLYLKRTPASSSSVNSSKLPDWTGKYLLGGNSEQHLPIEIHNIDKVGTDLWISSIKNALLVVLAPLNAVRVDHIENSAVVLGPVAGSVHIEQAKNSSVIVACRQIRIHDAKDVDFMLSTMSRPIIEHSTKTTFAPYVLRYTGLCEDIVEAKIILSPEVKHDETKVDGADSDLSFADKDESKQIWTQVDDFNWLRQTQSPNWSIVPKSDRLTSLILPQIHAPRT